MARWWCTSTALARSNGDGGLDSHDPAFAAIRVWVDINNDGHVDTGEMQSPQLSSINFTTGQINYTDGQSNALTATTLTSDTDGMKVDKFKVVGTDGKLHEVDAGTLIVHEGYEGLVRVNSKGQIVADDDPDTNTHLVAKRTNTYELDAKRTGDWEGTADQAQHRHGGENVAGTPTETSVTGVTSVGAVLGRENVKNYTTMDVGDKRIRRLTPPDQTARVMFLPGSNHAPIAGRQVCATYSVAVHATNRRVYDQFSPRARMRSREGRPRESSARNGHMRNRDIVCEIREEEFCLQNPRWACIQIAPALVSLAARG